MKRTQLRWLVLVGFLAGVMWLSLPRESVSEPQPELSFRPAVQVVAQARPSSAPVVSDDRVRVLEAQLEKERAVTQQAIKTIAEVESRARAPEVPRGADSPMLFGSSRPADFQPSRFGEIARAVERECKLGLGLLELDCNEFPCIAWMKVTGEQKLTMEGCAPWQSAFGDRTMVVGMGRLQDGSAVVGWMPVPEDTEEGKVATHRSAERAKATVGQRFFY